MYPVKLIYNCLDRFTGVSGKEGAIQLTSEALIKKNIDKSLLYEGNAIIETTPETDDSVQKVINAYSDSVSDCICIH